MNCPVIVAKDAVPDTQVDPVALNEVRPDQGIAADEGIGNTANRRARNSGGGPDSSFIPADEVWGSKAYRRQSAAFRGQSNRRVSVPKRRRHWREPRPCFKLGYAIHLPAR
ncbi:MAG TPA: hypothetical protein VFD64_03530 [Gemmatimonadaceae bacterium]|nr:hypothetical protein [Gemmatimonadaceae bacterium]